MGVHAYRFPIHFSPVHTYNRLCFKKTIFHSHWPKSIPMFSLSSSEIKVWSTNLSLWVLLRNGLTQNITGTQWLRNSVESSKVGLFGFKSRHNNKLKHLTLRTCCKSWKHELKDTKLAVKYSYSSRDQTLLYHWTFAFHSPQNNGKNSVLETLGRVHSFCWLRRAFEKQFRILVDAPW